MQKCLEMRYLDANRDLNADANKSYLNKLRKQALGGIEEDINESVSIGACSI